MARRRLLAELELGDSFVIPLTAARDSAACLRNEWALRDATWEPHDWRDW